MLANPNPNLHSFDPQLISHCRQCITYIGGDNLSLVFSQIDHRHGKVWLIFSDGPKGSFFLNVIAYLFLFCYIFSPY